MPSGNGTGPWGLGPRTGRKRGRCFTGNRYTVFSPTLFSGKKGLLFGIIIPVFAAIIRDLLNPSGILRQISRSPSINNHRNVVAKEVSDADYSIVDDESHTIVPPDHKDITVRE